MSAGLSPADLARKYELILAAGAKTLTLDRDEARDVIAYLWAASWAELLGWDCKRREMR